MYLQSGDLFLKLSELLEKGLAATAAKIPGEIKADFQNLGHRMEAIENKLDMTVAATNQNSNYMQTLQDRLDLAIYRIDKHENRSRTDQTFRTEASPSLSQMYPRLPRRSSRP